MVDAFVKEVARQLVELILVEQALAVAADSEEFADTNRRWRRHLVLQKQAVHHDELQVLIGRRRQELLQR